MPHLHPPDPRGSRIDNAGKILRAAGHPGSFSTLGGDLTGDQRQHLPEISDEYRARRTLARSSQVITELLP